MEIKNSIRNIDPDSFLDAKLYAVETGQTLGEVISEAIDLMLHEVHEYPEDDRLRAHHVATDEVPEGTFRVTGPVAFRGSEKSTMA